MSEVVDEGRVFVEYKKLKQHIQNTERLMKRLQDDQTTGQN
jgi:hypothetical protein